MSRHPELVELRAQGLSSAAIARELGLTRNQVVGRLNRMGIIGNIPKQAPYVPKYLRGEVNRGEYWDEKLFEPYYVWKARRARERAQHDPR